MALRVGQIESTLAGIGVIGPIITKELFMPPFLRRCLRSLLRGSVFAVIMFLFQRIAVKQQRSILAEITAFLVYCIIYAAIDFVMSSFLYKKRDRNL